MKEECIIKTTLEDRMNKIIPMIPKPELDWLCKWIHLDDWDKCREYNHLVKFARTLINKYPEKLSADWDGTPEAVLRLALDTVVETRKMIIKHMKAGKRY